MTMGNFLAPLKTMRIHLLWGANRGEKIKWKRRFIILIKKDFPFPSLLQNGGMPLKKGCSGSRQQQGIREWPPSPRQTSFLFPNGRGKGVLGSYLREKPLNDFLDPCRFHFNVNFFLFCFSVVYLNAIFHFFFPLPLLRIGFLLLFIDFSIQKTKKSNLENTL